VNIKTTLKLSVAAAALFAIATPVASPANAADDTLSSGNKNKLQVSGQVVRALWYADDGEHSHLFNTDGNTAHTRVRWVASGSINENVTAGATIEHDIGLSNTTATANFGGSTDGGDSNTDTTTFGIRFQYVWVNHKKFGKISLGNTDGAANGNSEATLAGIGLGTPNAQWQGTAINFLETGTTATGSSTGVTVGAVTSNLDFTSRTDVIRYDTPNFMGFTAAATLSGAGTGEIGARYSGKIGPVNIVATVGYTEMSSTAGAGGTGVGALGTDTLDYILAGALALRHDSGLNASVHGGKAPLDNTGATRGTPNFWAVQGGYQAKIFKVGNTNMRVVYNQSKQINARGSQGETWGIDVMQYFNAVGATVSLSYRNYDYQNDRIGDRTIDSVDVFGLQTLFAF